MFITHLLFLSFPFLIAADHRRTWESTPRGIKWLKKDLSVLIYLPTPDLLFWNPEERVGEDVPTGFILNFTISHDKQHLLLQDEPFLPLPDVNVPPQLFAYQTQPTSNGVIHLPRPNRDHNSRLRFALDYDRRVHPRDDRSISYYNHHPTVTLNLLGAGIAGHNTLLASKEQQVIKITLKDENSPTQNPPNHKFTIDGIGLWNRDWQTPHKAPEDTKQCSIWSWRCEDFGNEPWYQYIYRQNFDEFGRIGSLRHEIHQRWATLYTNLGALRFWVLIVAIASGATISVVFIVFSVWKHVRWIGERFAAVRAAYRKRETERRQWLDDEEECEGLLLDEERVKRFEEYERNSPPAYEGGEASGTTVVEKQSPPVPAVVEHEKP